MSRATDAAPAQRFRDLLAARFGLRFEDGKLGVLGDLLERRAAARNLPVDSYLIAAASDDDEAGPLAEELTVGETYFFRSGDQFRAFRDIVLPAALAARGPSGPLSILSAGCSSGEEAFTIAMLIAEAAPPPRQVSIRAVDLNPAALRKARSGRFGAWALRETPPEMLRQWFTPQGRDMQLADRVRSAVQFDRRNLADPESDIWWPGAYDAIFCRNVIMYFTPATQRAVIGRIARSLAPGGYLFLGHAETLRGLSQDFHLVHTHNTFYYQRRAAGDVAPARHYVPGTRDLPSPDPAPLAAGDTSWYAAIGRASRHIEALARPTKPVPAETAAPRWNLGVALELLQRERFAEALALLAKLPAGAARDPEMLLLRALLLAQTGKLAAAKEACLALLAEDELNAGAHYVLALCFEGSDDSAAAIDHYGVASHLDPHFAMPRLRRGLLLRRAGRLDAARGELDLALELLMREETARLQLFGGGFTRAALSRLCAAELKACGVAA